MSGPPELNRLLAFAVQALVDSEQPRVRRGEPPLLAAGTLVPVSAVQTLVDGEQPCVRRGELPLRAAGTLVPAPAVQALVDGDQLCARMDVCPLLEAGTLVPEVHHCGSKTVAHEDRQDIV